MTLDKHELQGIGRINRRTMPAPDFEALLDSHGYSISGSAPAQGKRVKVWFSHPTYNRIESIYSPDRSTVITAYHPD